MVNRYWFTIGMVIAVPLGLYFYEVGDFLYLKSSYITFAAMFFTGLNLNLDRFSFNKNTLLVILVSTSITCLLSPIIFYGFGKLLLYDKELFIGLIVLSVLPTTLISHIVTCQEAGGNSVVSTFCTISSNVLSIFLTPFFLIWLTEVDIKLSTIDLLIRLSLIVILPIIIAQLLKTIFKDFLSRYNWLYSRIAQFLVLVFVFISISINRSQFISIHDFIYDFIKILFIVILLHFVLLLLSYFTGRFMRFSRENKISLLFSASQKTIATGIAILSIAIPGAEKGAITIILYHFFQILFDNYIAVNISLRKYKSL